MKFKIIFSTGCLFNLPLIQVAEIAQKSGFGGLELILNDPGLFLQKKELVKVDSILPIVSLHAPFRDFSKWGGHLEAWDKTIGIAKMLPHVQNITFHPPIFRLKEIAHFWWFVKTKNLPKDLDSPIPLSLENLPVQEENFMTTSAISRLLNQCKNKGVLLTLDVCHLGVSGGDILKVFEVIQDWTVVNNIHFSDVRGFKEHLFPGQGELPLFEFVQRLATTNYDKTLTLEVGPASLPQEQKAIIAKLTDFLEQIEA